MVRSHAGEPSFRVGSANKKHQTCNLKLKNYSVVYCPGDGIGIRVGLRSQILRVRVSPEAPNLDATVVK